MLFGDEAAVKGIILPGNVGEVEVGLPLLDHETFVLIFVGFHHELGGVELVHTYSADKGVGIFVFGLVLVELFLLDVFIDVEQEGFHPLSEYQQIFADKAMGTDYAFVDLPDLETAVVTGTEQIVIFGQPEHPVPVFFLLLHLQLALGLVVPDPQGLVLGVADEGSSFTVKDNC